MSNEVFANGMEISCKSGDAKVIAAFPDVCLSPPSPPAGPIPIPYPNTSFSKDMKNGSKTVQINGKEVMLKDKSFLKTSPLGNEAATKTLGAGVVSHVITGKTYYVAWSMDVKFEGMNVDRHVDFTTTNHASPMTNGAGTVSGESSEKKELKSCPCCDGPLHQNQKDSDEKALPTQTEEQYYDTKLAFYTKRVKDAEKWFTANPDKKNIMRKVSVCHEKANVKFSEVASKQLELVHKVVSEYKGLRAANKDCRNVHKSDEKCGTHFVVPREKRTVKNKEGVDITGTPAQLARRETTPGIEREVRRSAKKKYPDAKTTGDIAHMTPLDAGGCPINMGNMIPQDTIEGENCKKIEKLQSCIQSLGG